VSDNPAFQGIPADDQVDDPSDPPEHDEGFEDDDDYDGGEISD